MPISKLKAGSIASGTLDNDRIPSLSASKIGSGTFADARIAASNVSQHATSFDDNPIQSKIALLGFKTATNGSLAAYNLTDQVIDEFTSNAGINTSSSTNDTLVSGYYTGNSAPAHNADNVSEDGSDTILKWTTVTSSGTFTPASNVSTEFLVVAGGGGGGGDGETVGGAGGGAGGLRTSYGSTSGGGASAESNLSLVAGTTYTITVGAGGTGSTSRTNNGSNGGASSIVGSDITDITTVGGGKAAHTQGNIGTSGGSGGGSSYNTGTPATGTSGQGFDGGTSSTTGGSRSSGGGGGGAGGAGGNSSQDVAPNGGAGLNISITGASVGYGGGGAAGSSGSYGQGSATHGGGAAGASGGNNDGNNAAANTGGGGGGASVTGSGQAAGGDGGSGIVIMRIPTTAYGSIQNLTLQSTSKTASSVPTQSDFVMLMENGAGTATLNTDVKAFISRDGGSTFTQGTLVEEGTYETNKKILAFHDLDISSQPSGTNLVYKITTHNQSASKETRIHAASIGWR